MKHLNSTMICGLPARVLGTFAIAALLMGLSVLPAAADDDKSCSNASLKGDYAYAVNGTSLTIPPVGPVAILGKITADGNGSFSGSINVNLTGIIITDVPVTGTYSVASDCTGTLTTVYPAFTAHFSLVLVEGSKRAELVETDAGTVGTGTVNR